MMKKFSVALLFPLLLGGCSLFSPTKPVQVDTYTISVPPQKQADKKIRFDSVLMLTPTNAQVPFNSRQMYYTRGENRLNTYTYSQWANAPANMIYLSLWHYLDTRGPFKATINSEVFAQPKYKLTLTMNELILKLPEKNASKQEASMHLSTTFYLIDIRQSKFINSHTFTINQSTAISPKGFAKAANQATRQLCQEVHQWLNKQTLPQKPAANPAATPHSSGHSH